jgi:hypothetical protein
VDLLAILVLASLVLGVSYWRLRVYHQVTVWEVSLTRMTPNEAPRPLAVPEQIRRSFSATLPPAQAIASLERDIRAYMRSGQVAQSGDAPSRFEWHIRYSFNTTNLDQERWLVFEADGSEHAR